MSPIKFCPGCGSIKITWKSAKCFVCMDCGFQLYLNVAAAVAVIIECQGRILFGVRKNEPAKGMLDLPGGFVDPGEPADAAALRELYEETGLRLTTVGYFCSLPNIYPYRGVVYDTLDLIFSAKLDSMPDLKAADDLAELVWLDIERIELDRIGFVSLREAVRRYAGVRLNSQAHQNSSG